MPRRSTLPRSTALILAAVALLAAPMTTAAADPPSYDFTGPVFGLATAPSGALVVADAGSGVVTLRKAGGRVIANLPGVTDIAPIGLSSMWAVTGGGPDPTSGKLYRVSNGRKSVWGDLAAFEARVNPHPAEVDSNPFDVAALSGGKALIADAGANALIISTAKGRLDWVATLPDELVPTDWIKGLAGCPDAPPDFAFVCGLPEMFPAEAVATSIAIGPDGAWYVGELKGFPAGPGQSRIWRIERGTRHADCGTSDRCSVVADGLTSIVDLAFTPSGKLDVVELDEGGFLPLELGMPGLGGTVDRCDVHTGACSVLASGLTMPIAVAEKGSSTYALVNALIPGAAQVIKLP
jgi:hypothetical protein